MISQEYKEDIKIILQKIEEADAIAVGGGSGISSAAGYKSIFNSWGEMGLF